MPIDDLTALGDALRAARKQKNLTQEQLADESHVSTKQIADIEKARRNPSYLILKALAKVVHLSLDSLICPDLSPDEAGQNEMKLLYMNCPPEMRETLLRHTRGFVEELKESYPELEIAGVQASFDETKEVQRIIENGMMAVSGISGILVVSGGQAGVAEAFSTLKLDRRPYVVIYDHTPKNEKALRENTVDFLIDQNGYVQGYRPLNILADMILKGKLPEEEYLYTDIKIMTKYTLASQN